MKLLANRRPFIFLCVHNSLCYQFLFVDFLLDQLFFKPLSFSYVFY